MRGERAGAEVGEGGSTNANALVAGHVTKMSAGRQVNTIEDGGLHSKLNRAGPV